MKTETWNGHGIRLVKKNGEWFAVANDVAEALGYERPKDAVSQHCKGAVKHRLPTNSGQQAVNIIPKKDIYRLIMRSNKPEAEAFQDWVYDLLKQIREEVLGLKAYEAFRMMDKEHQKEAMRRLNESLHAPAKVDYIKANAIADKAVSTRYGFPKMVKKGAMNEAMLRDREPALDDTVQLMALNDRLGLGLSVSAAIYRKYGGGAA